MQAKASLQYCIKFRILLRLTWFLYHRSSVYFSHQGTIHQQKSQHISDLITFFLQTFDIQNEKKPNSKVYFG